jgi:uncharacterized membrane protein
MTSAFTPVLLVFADQPAPEVWARPLTGLMVALSLIISAVGVAIVVWGAYCSVLRLIQTETAAALGQAAKPDVAAGRLLFATYLLPALDFMIAGSVIRTAAGLDWQQAAVLASLVLARTLLGLSVKGEAASAGALEKAPEAVRSVPVAETPPAPGPLVGLADSPRIVNRPSEDSAPVDAQPAR